MYTYVCMYVCIIIIVAVDLTFLFLAGCTSKNIKSSFSTPFYPMQPLSSIHTTSESSSIHSSKVFLSLPLHLATVSNTFLQADTHLPCALTSRFNTSNETNINQKQNKLLQLVRQSTPLYIYIYITNCDE